MRRVFQLLLSILLIFQIQCVIASDDLYSFYYSGESEFINRFNASLKSYAKAKDIDLEMFDAKNNSSVQLNQIYSSVSSKDPLIINLVDTEQASEIIYHAKSYRNRIVFFNRKPSDDVFKKYDRVWYVGTNSAAAGKYQAELISDYIELTKNVDRNRNGVLDIIILQGEKDHGDTTGRSSEILKQLSDKKVKYKVLSENFDDWDTQTAFNDVKTLASKVGLKNIDMIIANNDAMAVGAVDFFNTQGYNLGADSKDKTKYIPVFGVDGIPEAIEYIRQEKMTGTVFADFSALAKASVDIALDDSLDDEVLTRKIWYKIKDRKVLIPFVKYSSFKSYFKKSR
ncbi:galactose ABC transporter substrate-binding protein [Succinivibrio dextrinosolvens]|uniref:galactose ABC transporter substrate-binding protein n=1 Tax=Succinivibrio dextrinosolvens TaxID=83771 RepID=UPI001920C80B|nr:galactose ABC transporter substrate-binding protein [Succinivibrio dextrinosolvens]